MLNLKNVHRTIFLLLITTIEKKSPESEMNTLVFYLDLDRLAYWTQKTSVFLF